MTDTIARLRALHEAAFPNGRAAELQAWALAACDTFPALLDVAEAARPCQSIGTEAEHRALRSALRKLDKVSR